MRVNFTKAKRAKLVQPSLKKQECVRAYQHKTMRKNKSLDDEILEIEIRLIRHLIDMMSFETQIGLKKRLKKLRVEKSWQELVREISDSR